MATLTIADLNQVYNDAKSADRDAHAEMRSNVLLIAGDHYTKKLQEFFNVRNAKQPTENKLRITKNWIHRAHRIYMNSILSQSPGVTAEPNNPYELQHQKSAELNNAVMQHAKKKYKLRGKYRKWCSDFVGIGEACVKIYFDPRKGRLKGYEGKVNEMGEPLADEAGNQLADETKPVMSGEFVFERMFGHQIFRDPSVTCMEESPFIGVEKLVSMKSLRMKYKGDEEKLKFITKSNENFIIFDPNKGGYGKESEMACVREYFYRICDDYPEGYYYYTTKEGILEEGPLPQGIFPIVWVGFDEHQTKARATSMVRVAKPWQAEINRASSQAALHQITTGDDKILTQAGTKLDQGTTLPGVRGLTYTGQTPVILPGRSGDQFFNYIDRNENEMSRALLIDQLDQEKMNNLDPYAMLFRSMSSNKNFVLYSETFGEFLVEIHEVFLELAKYYLDDDEFIAAVGKSELINIAEFRDTNPLYHKITLEEQADTVETKLGKHLTMTHLLQYVGNKLSTEDIGKLMINAPFGNWEDSLGHLTADSRNVKNDFLAMERGEQPRVSPRDDSDYCLKEIATRKKERDYGGLDPQVQALYDQYEQYHIQKKQEEQQALKQAESEFIPTGGAMIACDMYLPTEDPSKAPKRARVPYQALDFLLKMLEQQGMSQDTMASMNSAQQAEVVNQMQQGQARGLPTAAIG